MLDLERMSSEAEALRQKLRDLARPGARRESPHHVLSVPEEEVRRLARQTARKHRNEDVNVLVSLAGELWQTGVHEEMTLALVMLQTLERFLDDSHWNVFKTWMEDVRTVDHCDRMARELLGAIVTRDRTFVRVLRHWARSENVWVRRAAVLGVFLRARQMSDIEAALSVCEPLMADKEPLVREAVELILKECVEVDAAMTAEFRSRWSP